LSIGSNMGEVAVKLAKVSKKYVLHHEKPTLVENILFKKTKEEFWALKDINLTINKGERIGIIGPNGSGKTTLLEIISEITTPTTGTVATNGKLVSLIELEAGFHPDLTGEENVFLNGLLIGMTKTEIKSKLKQIVSFAEVDQFIDSPMYTYSEGMKLRLSFSIAVHANPDTLALDENIAVGDQEFRNKSFQKIQDFFVQGKTVIIVTHYLNFLKKSCKRVIWLDKGKVKKDGKAREVIRLYEKSVR